eukprot:749086-Hanusia_phi.AAC.3
MNWRQVGSDLNQGNEIENNARLPVEGSSDFEQVRSTMLYSSELISESLQTAGYRGPCPSKTEDRHHTYSIVLFALNVSTLGPTLRAWSKWKDVRKKMQPHLVAQEQVVFKGSPTLDPSENSKGDSDGDNDDGGGRGGDEDEDEDDDDGFDDDDDDDGGGGGGDDDDDDSVKRRRRGIEGGGNYGPGISEIEEKLDGVCNQNHYMNHPFPPLQISRACQYMLSEFEEVKEDLEEDKGGRERKGWTKDRRGGRGKGWKGERTAQESVKGSGCDEAVWVYAL